MTATFELGRRRGVFVPVREVEAHLACGWAIIDDLAGRAPWPGTVNAAWLPPDGVLMALPAPPAIEQQEKEKAA